MDRFQYIEQLKQKCEQDIGRYLISAYSGRIEHVISLATALKTEAEHTWSQPVSSKSLYELFEVLEELLEEKYIIKDAEGFSQSFPSFTRAIEANLGFVPEKMRERQSDDRFNAKPENSLVLKVLKLKKRIVFGAQVVLRKALKPLGYKKEPSARWHQFIPLKNLAAYTLKYQLIDGIIRVILEKELRIIEAICAFKDSLDKLMLDTCDEKTLSNSLRHMGLEIDRLTSIKEQFVSDIVNQNNLVFNKLSTWAEKVGTIELSAFRFSENRTKRGFLKTNRRYKTKIAALNRSHVIIKGDWILRLQLDGYFHRISQTAKTVKTRFTSRIEKQVNKHLDSLIAFIESSREDLVKGQGSKAELIDLLKNQRGKGLSELKNELVPSVIKNIFSQNLPGLLLRFNGATTTGLDEVQEKVYVVKGFSPSKIPSQGEMKSFNPQMVAKETCLPDLKLAISEIENVLFSHNHKVQPALQEIASIFNYTIESALATVDDESIGLGQIQTGIEEGFNRAVKRVELLKEYYAQVSKEVFSGLDAALKDLQEKLTELGFAENALELNLKIISIKARTHTIGYWTQYLAKMKLFWRFIAVKFLKGWRKALGIYKETENSLAQAKQEVKRSDLNRLTDVTKAFNKLPFIYNMLFKPRPLEDYSLFVEHNAEIKQLSDSLNAWAEDRVANVLITGPKGGGLTSLFNYFQENKLKNETVNRIEQWDTVDSLKQLLDILKVTFNYSKVESIDELAEKVNSGDFRRVVFVDELQNFFVREVGGFEVLKELIQFMSLTSKSVFWVSTITEICFNYLNKTMNLSTMFTKVVELQPISKVKMSEFLYSRHQVSGYDLVFNWPEMLDGRKAKKLNEREKLDYFKKLFASKIWEESAGSLHLALLLWVMSIESVDEQSVVVKPTLMETNMVKNLTDNKLVVLYMLLLHDGLEIGHLAKTTGYTLNDCKAILYSLIKDGMVLKFDDHYASNLLLYKSLTRTLASKNILH